MSPVNVHINRYPISGVVSFFKYHPGKFLVAYDPKSSTDNERTTVVVKHKTRHWNLISSNCRRAGPPHCVVLQTGRCSRSVPWNGFHKIRIEGGFVFPIGNKTQREDWRHRAWLAIGIGRNLKVRFSRTFLKTFTLKTLRDCNATVFDLIGTQRQNLPFEPWKQSYFEATSILSSNKRVLLTPFCLNIVRKNKGYFSEMYKFFVKRLPYCCCYGGIT